MKKITKILACIILSVALAFTAICVYASTYSSEDDPLISLSYVNEVLLPQVKQMIYDVLGGEDIGDVVVTSPVEEPEETTTEPKEEPEVPAEVFPEGTVNAGSRFVIVNLTEGQTLYASVYSCEAIVRSGSTKVVSPYTVKWEEQGVSDITDGKELYNEAEVPANHTILIPRDDGRGITANAGGAWVMVRGDYIIKDAAAPIAETTAEATEDTTAETEG